MVPGSARDLGRVYTWNLRFHLSGSLLSRILSHFKAAVFTCNLSTGSSSQKDSGCSISVLDSTHRPLKPIVRLKVIRMENSSWGHYLLSSVDSFPESTCFCSLSGAFRNCFFHFSLLSEKGVNMVWLFWKQKHLYQMLCPDVTWISIFQTSANITFLPTSEHWANAPCFGFLQWKHLTSGYRFLY